MNTNKYNLEFYYSKRCKTLKGIRDYIYDRYGIFTSDKEIEKSALEIAIEDEIRYNKWNGYLGGHHP